MRLRVCFAVFLLALSSVVLGAQPPGTSPGTYQSQGAALSACQGYAGWNGDGMTCVFAFPGSSPGVDTRNPPSCVFPRLIGGPAYRAVYNGQYWGTFTWCVPGSCTAGASPNGTSPYTMNDPGGLLGGGHQVSEDSCCAHLVLQQSSWSAPDKSDATSTGYFQLDGGYCPASILGTETNGQIPKPVKLTPYQPHCPAGKASCYNPFDDNFCSQSQSGEWFCVPRQNPPPGGCISGATGAVCVGKDGQPVPPPSDPPIKPGTPPDATNNYTITNNTTTNNYTTNNYSGTSDGGGSGSSSGGSSTSGGNQSNLAGNGNSGSRGTDSTGKCADGKVPTASGCSGTYADNGCDTPPACFGDAVMCGQARELHAIKCNTAPAAGGSSGGSDDPGSGDGIDGPGASSVSNSVDLGDGAGSLDAGGFGYSRSCPLQDMTFTVMGKTVTVAMADKCQYLDWVGYLVLAMAYLAAAKIIAGVR